MSWGEIKMFYALYTHRKLLKVTLNLTNLVLCVIQSKLSNTIVAGDTFLVKCGTNVFAQYTYVQYLS
jgi:hypothetical protein